jgi:hypothetical protein
VELNLGAGAEDIMNKEIPFVEHIAKGFEAKAKLSLL